MIITLINSGSDDHNLRGIIRKEVSKIDFYLLSKKFPVFFYCHLCIICLFVICMIAILLC
jgi:hypothetical protein